MSAGWWLAGVNSVIKVRLATFSSCLVRVWKTRLLVRYNVLMLSQNRAGDVLTPTSCRRVDNHVNSDSNSHRTVFYLCTRVGGCRLFLCIQGHAVRYDKHAVAGSWTSRVTTTYPISIQKPLKTYSRLR